MCSPCSDFGSGAPNDGRSQPERATARAAAKGQRRREPGVGRTPATVPHASAGGGASVRASAGCSRSGFGGLRCHTRRVACEVAMSPAPAAARAREDAPVDTAAALRGLPALLRDEPALAQVLGRASATLAVPEAARALVTAGLTELSSRRPMVLAVPTSTEAERLAHDLAAFLGDDAVELFPAWETLPFERVSPGVETMGRRLRVLWRLRDESRSPSVVVASVRGLGQRPRPPLGDGEPLVVRPGQQLDRDAVVAELVAAGYRRGEMVEHRGGGG